MKKLLCFIATFSLLINTLLAPMSALAQSTDESPTPTSESTSTPEATIEPTIAPTETPTEEPIVVPSESATPTSIPEPTESETPTPTDQSVETQAPESNPTTVGPPASAEPTTTPTTTPTIAPQTSVEEGHISATILENTKIDESEITDFDLTYQEDGSATISTDKLDYAPTDTAIITGSGFIANKTYTINITSSDEPAVDYSTPITANEKGEILHSYTLDGTYRPNYQVRIKDLERVVAETTFLDHSNYVMKINGDASTTTSKDVILNLSWRTGFLSPDPTFVRFVNINATSSCPGYLDSRWSSWETLSDMGGNTATMTRTLTDGAGMKKVCSQTGHLFPLLNVETYSDTIQYAPDTEKPVITLNGSSTIDVELGDVYSELGASVTDNVDTGLTTTITGSVNTFIIGAYLIYYNATDTAGNSAVQVVRTVNVVDTTPPTPPTLESPINGVYRHTSDSNFSDWSDVIDPSGVTYRYQSAPSTSFTTLHYDSMINGSSPGPLTESMILNPGEPEVTYYWRVQACDGLNNCSAWTAPWQINIDNTAPIITIDPYITTPTNQDITVTASTNEGSLNFSSHLFTVNDSFDFIAVDLAGNTTTETVTITNIDKDVPSNPTIIFTAGGNTIPTNKYTNSKTFTFNLSSSTDTTRYQLKYWNDIPGSVFKIGTPWNPKNLTSIYNDQFTQGEGKHYFAFSACDAAGNCSDYSSQFIVTYDKTDPVVEITFPLSGDYINGTVDLTGNIIETNLLRYYYQIKEVATGTVVASKTVNTSSLNNQTFYTWNTNGWPDGEYLIQLAARDLANNRGVESEHNISIFVDKSAPTGTWVNPLDNATVSGIVTLNFDAQDNLSGVANVLYKYKAVGEIDFRTDGNIVGDLWDTTTLPLGDYILRATATDSVGNTADFDITVGVSAIVSSQSAISTSYSEATITWTTDKPTTSRVVYDTVGHDLGTEPNYGYAFSTTEDTNKVTSHSVTLTGLTAGITYFYRVISHGSPVTVGGEGTFNVLSVAGAPAPSGNASSAVLGITAPLSSWPKLAYLETTEGDESDVLGAETDITATQGGSFTPTTDDQKVGVIKWVLTHKKISLGVVILLLLLIYLLSKRKNKN